MTSIVFENPAWEQQRGYIESNARQRKIRMLHGGEGAGLTVLICGAGPSLETTYTDVMHRFHPEAVWGCNAALRWLWSTGRDVSHGVSAAGEEGLLDDWQPLPPVQYYVSSGIWPVIPRLLIRRHRKVFFYHVMLGHSVGFPHLEDEAAWYRRLFPPALCIPPTGGFNVTNIAVCLAIGMGFSRIIVAGADCCLALDDSDRPDPGADVGDDAFTERHLAWKSRQRMYVDGRDAVTAFGPHVVLPEGVICGRRFASRPDMLLSALHLVKLVKQYPRRVILVGDTLPNWLLRHPEETWLEAMPQVNAEGVMVNLSS